MSTAPDTPVCGPSSPELKTNVANFLERTEETVRTRPIVFLENDDISIPKLTKQNEREPA